MQTSDRMCATTRRDTTASSLFEGAARHLTSVKVVAAIRGYQKPGVKPFTEESRNVS
jgi:hypothetical protein